MNLSMLDAARMYVANGFSVIPVSSGTKMPDSAALIRGGAVGFNGRGSWREYRDKPADDEVLQLWFGDNASSNLGVVTGYGNLAAVDFDDMQAFSQWKKEFPRLAETALIQLTRKGLHLFFRCRKLPDTGLWPYDLSTQTNPSRIIGNLKGRSDYLLVWPSLHPRGVRYRWAEDFLPWEVIIPEISDISELGLRVAISHGRLVARAFSGAFLHPVETARCLLYARQIVMGEKCDTNLAWRPESYLRKLKQASLRGDCRKA